MGGIRAGSRNPFCIKGPDGPWGADVYLSSGAGGPLLRRRDTAFTCGIPLPSGVLECVRPGAPEAPLPPTTSRARLPPERCSIGDRARNPRRSSAAQGRPPATSPNPPRTRRRRRGGPRRRQPPRDRRLGLPRLPLPRARPDRDDGCGVPVRPGREAAGRLAPVKAGDRIADRRARPGLVSTDRPRLLTLPGPANLVEASTGRAGFTDEDPPEARAGLSGPAGPSRGAAGP
jgi:hypothetical protein